MKLIGGIFLAFGLLFTGLGSWFYLGDLDLAMSGDEAEGRVVSFESSYNSDSGTTYRPVVEYEDASGRVHRFTGGVGSSPKAYDRGETVDVIYDPASPEDALLDSFTERLALPLAFGGFGLLFGGIGGAILFFGWRRQKIIAQLKESGLPISAQFLECYNDRSIKVNGRSPWRVVAQATHPATGQLTSFKSDPLWVNPGEQLVGKELRVFVDPARPKRHYIDLSEYISEEDIG